MRATLLPVLVLAGCPVVLLKAARNGGSEADSGAVVASAPPDADNDDVTHAPARSILPRGGGGGGGGGRGPAGSVEEPEAAWWVGVKDLDGVEATVAPPDSDFTLVVHLDRETPTGVARVRPSPTLSELLPDLKSMDVFVYLEEAYFPGAGAPERANVHRNDETGGWTATLSVRTGERTGRTRVGVAAWTAQGPVAGRWHPLDGVDLPLCVTNRANCPPERNPPAARFRLDGEPAPYAIQVVRLKSGKVLAAVSGPEGKPSLAGGDAGMVYDAYHEVVARLADDGHAESVETLVHGLVAATEQVLGLGPMALPLPALLASVSAGGEGRAHPRLTVSTAGVSPAEFPVELLPLSAFGLEVPGLAGKRLRDLFDVEWQLPYGGVDVAGAAAPVQAWQVYLPDGSSEPKVGVARVDLEFSRALQDVGFAPWGARPNPYGWWAGREGVLPARGPLPAKPAPQGALGVYLVGHVGVRDGKGTVALGGPAAVGPHVSLGAPVDRQVLWPQSTVLVINGCGSLGLRDEAFVQRLNAAGASTIVGTAFKVPWEMVADFDACFADQLERLTVAERIGDIFRRTVDCLAEGGPNGSADPWGEAAYNYRLLGSLDTLVAPLPARAEP